MTPHSDGGYASDTMGPPQSPPASSSDGDEFDDDDRFGPHIVIPDGCWANYSHPDVVESPVLGRFYDMLDFLLVAHECQSNRRAAIWTETISEVGRTANSESGSIDDDDCEGERKNESEERMREG
jgi:hypothetical protein